MYCDYFGLSREPFSIAPDPAFIYPSTHHRQALAHLKYGLEREGGFLLLTGEVGTGKTTLVRLLIEQIPASFRIAYVLNATLDRLDILASVCEELGLEIEPGVHNAKYYVDRLNADLLKAHAQGRKTLVIIEEAQNLAPEVLEFLRLLTNLETNTTKLLHILLVGQPELLEVIGRPELRQLNQRIVSRFHLLPLDREETERYLQHRLSRAGCSRTLFDASAVRKLHQLADGVPRKLNLIAERALLGTYAESRDRVSGSQVAKAKDEVFGETVRRRPRIAVVASLAVLLGALGIAAFFYSEYPGEPAASVVSPAPAVEEVLPAASSVIQEPVLTEMIAAEAEIPAGPAAENAPGILLDLWSLSGSVQTVADLCGVALESGLFCSEQSMASVNEIEAINRPMLVKMDGDDYVLASLNDLQFRLLNTEGEQWLSSASLAQRWTGEVVYLWRPPVGYSGSLRPGERNSTVVNWLLARLQQLDPEQPPLITGGNYSQALAQRVADFQRSAGLSADGVLGQKTLMKLNELEASVPLLKGVGN